MAGPFRALPRARTARLALLLVVTRAGGGAELHAQTRAGMDFGVRRWTTDDGLPSHHVTKVLQAADGTLWIWAGGAIAAFDGLTFQEIQPLIDGRTIEAPTDMAAGLADTLWVVTAAGRVAYRKGTGLALAYTLPVPLYSVAQGGDGRLWVQGMERTFVRRDRAFDPVGPPRVSPPNPRWMRQLWADSAGRAWRTSASGPLARIERLDVDVGTGFAVSWGSIIQGGPAGALGFRFEQGRVDVVDGSGRLRYRVPQAGTPEPLLVDGQSRLWVAVDGGLDVYDSLGASPRHVPLSDPTVRVEHLLEARNGSFWAGTAQHGLFRIQALPFRVYGTPAVETWTIGHGKDGSVLAVDLQYRLTRLSSEGEEVLLPGLPHDAGSELSNLTAAYEDRRGTLWLGAGWRGKPALVGRRAGLPDLILPIPQVPQRIAEDPAEDGLLWFSEQALYRARPYLSLAVDTVVPGAWSVRDFAFGPSGEVWVAGLSGLVHLRPDGRDEYPAAEGYPVVGARAVHLDSSGDVWVGTYQSGLVRVRGGRFLNVRAEDGLFENVVSAILEDDHGNLWMAGNRSVHRVSKTDVHAFMEGRAASVAGVGYGRRDGLRNPETSGWSAARGGSGLLWFPTFDGAAVVDPTSALLLDRDPPEVRLTFVHVNGRPVEAAGALSLSASERTVEIGFAGLFLRDPEGLRYQIRLEPSTPEWRDVGSTRSVSYAGLGPGEYRFSVRALNSSGRSSPAPATLAFSIAPRFRETPWFPLTGLLVLTALILSLRGARLRAARARAASLASLVEARTAELREEKRLTETQAARIHTLAEARSRFFANLSHELRTPLTLILGPLEEVAGSGTVEASRLSPALDSARRLGRLFDQMLDTARLEAGRLPLRRRTVDGIEFVRELAGLFAPLARRRDVSLRLELPDEPVPVSIDPDEADKIVLNLLGNALKFTPAGGHVGVRARRVDGTGGDVLEIVVEDDGPGIPEDAIERVFERFEQGHDEARPNGGAGLGLPLSRDLAELHGGSLEVAGSLPRGTRFTVRLPAEPRGTAMGDAAGATGARWMEPEEPAYPDAPAAPPSVDSDADVTTVLIVEDHPGLRAWLARHLALEYRVVEAGDGAQGLEEARRWVPDVIVSDVMMPGMGGEELCRAVKADPALAFVPVVLLTARGAREHRLSGLEGGADDYVVKPFDMEELLLRVRNLVASRRRLRERYAAESLVLPELPSLAPSPGSGPGAEAEADTAAFLDQLRRATLARLADEDLDVDALADALGVSRSTLYRRVEAALGGSPKEVIWRLRLEQAALWLRDTDASVAEIAYGVGFKSVPHFSRRFRERFGRTPTEHRQTR